MKFNLKTLLILVATICATLMTFAEVLPPRLLVVVAIVGSCATACAKQLVTRDPDADDGPTPTPPRSNSMLRKTTHLILAVVCAVAMLACTPEKTRAFARGMSGAARVIDKGIPTVRAIRLAGEISDGKALELARAARDVNNVLGAAVDFTLAQGQLDEAGRSNLHGQIEDVLRRARELREKGTIRLKSGRQQLVFDLLLIGGETALETIAGDLAAPLPAGVTIVIDGETRALLEQTARRIRDNEARLREAVERLSAAAVG